MVNASPQRKQTHGAVRRIVHFSDVHLNLSTTTEDFSSLRPRYGSDTPYSLLTSALKYASSVISQPDVLLFTGDHVTHGDNFTNNYIRRVVETNIRMLETYFPADPTTHKPHHVTAITGNADSNESYAMDTSTPDLTSTAAALSVVAPVWASSLSAADYDLFERRGYLQYDIDDTLTMLTLNTVPYSPSHYPDTSSILDPFDQFAWLDATLRDLRQMSRVAFIAGHIPPIVDSNRTNVMWHEHYIQSYRTIVREYRDIIKAQFFGHVHSLEFRIPPLEDGLTNHPVPPLFTSGALSPKYGNNPSFTVWEYDAETYELLDYTVHSTKWSEGTRFQWASLFQASSTYNIASLSTPEIMNLRSRMGTDESSQLREYYWNMKARSFNLPPCDDVACRARTFCSLTWWPTTIAFANCVASAKTHIIGSILPDSSWIPLLSLPQLLVAIVVLVVMFATMRAIVRFARRKFVVATVSSLTTWYSKKPEKKLPKRHGVLPYGPQNEDS